MSVVVGPRCNVRVTCDLSPSNDRSESEVAINPNDPYNIVAASKKFTDPATYTFSLAAYASFDAGQTWTEAAPLGLLPGWSGVSDPALAWDDIGNAYLFGLAFSKVGNTINFLGMAVYKSSDGGRTWSPPNHIYSNFADKQWAAGDASTGNVYAVWDGPGDGLIFARTMDHGASWKGPGNSATPGPVPLVTDSSHPAITVAKDGTIYIVWGGPSGTIKWVRSKDSGDTFSKPQTVATGIVPIPGRLPGGTFRVLTLVTATTGASKSLVVAWADYREGVSRIYYRRSPNGGNSWDGPNNGQPLLTGNVASAPNQHDFHPQLARTPSGELGCAFYEFGPQGGGMPPSLINVILAVSTDDAMTFPNRVTVTDQAWDPLTDPVTDEYGNGFIGDYFGNDASSLGFHPLFTSTKTGVQEIFTSRLSVYPADLYVRDSSQDDGDVPSPGFHWEAPDLIVRRQPDGVVNFVNQDLLRDGITDHYVYGRVTNRGPNSGRNVRLSVVVGNYPSLQALPGSEFRYPQDWYAGDWPTPAVQARHLNLGESASASVPNGGTQILGPILWPAGQIPDPAIWHPCLLGEVRSDNDDSAGGFNGCGIDADPDPCAFGSYFWGNNNVCQRNLSYATAPAEARLPIGFPFLVGSPWSGARFLEVLIDKGKELAFTPMTLRVDETLLPDRKPRVRKMAGELVFEEVSRFLVRVGDSEIGEVVAAPGTVWRPRCPPPSGIQPETCFGAVKRGEEWYLDHPKAGVGFPVEVGEMRRMTLSFKTSNKFKRGDKALISIYQRNDRRVITGGVFLELRGGLEKEPEEKFGHSRRKRREAMASKRRRR